MTTEPTGHNDAMRNDTSGWDRSAAVARPTHDAPDPDSLPIDPDEVVQQRTSDLPARHPACEGEPEDGEPRTSVASGVGLREDGSGDRK